MRPARTAGRTTVLVDAATIEPTPEGLALALTERLPTRATLASPRLALLIDSAERLAPIEGWLRTDFLPGLPGDALITMAGRRPPDSRWRSDLGWAEQLRSVALRDLGPDDAREYLTVRGVPEADVPAVLELTHGHPLALALVCDVRAQRDQHRRPGAGLSLHDLQDVVATLLERFVDDVPDETHRRALQVLGHARVTTEALLRAVLEPDRAQETFAWLRGLSFVELSSDGLAPHQLARSALDDDLRWRDHDSWLRLDQQIKAFYTQGVMSASGAEQARATADLLWFHRRSPALAAYEEWDAAFSLWSQPARPCDLAQILELVRDHEGDASVDLHRTWWEHQPEAFGVVRAEPGRVHGFFVTLRLGAEDGAALVAATGDPVAAAAWALVESSAPLRPGEHARVIRSWIGRDGYHRPSPTQQALTGATTRAWMTERGLAVTVAYAVDSRLWTPLFAYVDYARAPGGDVVVAGRDFAAYLHDWRVTPPVAWLELMAARGRTPRAAGDAEALRALAERHLAGGAGVLAREDFEAAVREAFRCVSRPAELARNPLLATRLVPPAAPDTPARARAAALRAVLEREIAALRDDSRRASSARALEVTYLAGVRTQVAAAARLGVPFSTYRRHLAAGLAAVTTALWERELAGGWGPG